MSLWEPFREEARRAIIHGQTEAVVRGSAEIAVEHLVAGLLYEPDTALATLLAERGLLLERLRQGHAAVKEATPTQELVFSAGAKRAIELAFQAARENENNFIAPEHLLWGALQAGDETLLTELARLEIDAQALAKAAIGLLARGKGPESSLKRPLTAMAEALLARLKTFDVDDLDDELRERLTDLQARIDALLRL